RRGEGDVAANLVTIGFCRELLREPLGVAVLEARRERDRLYRIGSGSQRHLDPLFIATEQMPNTLPRGCRIAVDRVVSTRAGDRGRSGGPGECASASLGELTAQSEQDGAEGCNAVPGLRDSST